MSPKFRRNEDPPVDDSSKAVEATNEPGPTGPVEDAKAILPEEELNVLKTLPDPNEGPKYVFHSRYDFMPGVPVAPGKSVTIKFQYMTFVLTPYIAAQLGTTVKELLGSPNSGLGLLGMSNHGTEFMLCGGPKVKHLPIMDKFKEAVEKKKGKTAKMVVGSRATADRA